MMSEANLSRRRDREARLGPILKEWRASGRADVEAMARELKAMGLYAPSTYVRDVEATLKTRLGLWPEWHPYRNKGKR